MTALRTDWQNGEKVDASDINEQNAEINAKSALVGIAHSQAEMLVLTGDVGDYCLRTDLNALATITALPTSSVANWLVTSPTPAVSKLLNVGNLGFATSGNQTSTSTAGTSQCKFTVGIATTGLSPLFQHWYTPISTFFDTDPTGPITFSADIRILSSSNPYAVLNTPFRLTFGGRITTTLDPGGEIAADPVGVSVLPGDVVAVRTYLSSGTAWIYRPPTYYAYDVGFTATTDLTMSATALGSGAGVNVYGPAQLLGRVENGNAAASFLAIGDSVMAGYGDLANGYRADIGAGGWVIRALTGKAGLVNAAVPGDRATVFGTTQGSLRRIRSAARASKAFLGEGINDFGIYNVTAAQLEALNLPIATDVRKMGISSVYMITLPPRTTSTDGWLTTTNQTPLSTESQRVAYNTWVRAGCPIDPTTKAAVAVGTAGALVAGKPSHPITGVIDIASAVESSLNSGRWAASGRAAAGSITSGTIALTMTTGTLTATNAEVGGDIGQSIFINGAGASGAGFIGTIATVPTTTSATVTGLASTTVSAAALVIGGSTNDGTHPSTKSAIAIAALVNPATL